MVAWASEQARLIRAGRFDLLDREHIAEEVEDVGKSEQRELATRMAVLLAHLLKWQHQPERRGASWEVTISSQRQRMVRRLGKEGTDSARLPQRPGLVGRCLRSGQCRDRYRNGQAPTPLPMGDGNGSPR